MEFSLSNFKFLHVVIKKYVR